MPREAARTSAERPQTNPPHHLSPPLGQLQNGTDTTPTLSPIGTDEVTVEFEIHPTNDAVDTPTTVELSPPRTPRLSPIQSDDDDIDESISILNGFPIIG